MKNVLSILLIIALFACNAGKSTKEEQEDTVETTPIEEPSYKLELVWASDSILITPESVLFDKERKVLYVANINQNPWEKDGNGFISRMDLTGNITDLRWVEGVSGPKGMGVYGNKLYVADIDEVVEIDIETAAVVGRYPVEGKPDLNDITVGGDGTVYVSGSTSNTIYVLKDGEITEFLSGGDEGFNGLFWEKDRLLLLTSGTSQFKEIDWNTKTMNVISENMGAGDGVVAVGDGSYLTSSWSGAIFHVSSEGVATKILDTEAIGENTADIDYSMEDNLLFVPTFFDNRVKAYRLVK
jgi:hypothetical protein